VKFFNLEARIALVTGASRGLGRAIAESLAQAGATVVLAARDAGKLHEVADGIRAAGGCAEVEAFDLLDEAAVEAVVPRIVRRLGRLDILVNNAGICIWGPLFESSMDVWRRTLDTNLTAVYLLAREAARPMVEQRWGRIINISSYVAAIGREPKNGSYPSAARAGGGVGRPF